MVVKDALGSAAATSRPMGGVQSVSYSPVTTIDGTAAAGIGRYHSCPISRVLCSTDILISSSDCPMNCAYSSRETTSCLRTGPVPGGDMNRWTSSVAIRARSPRSSMRFQRGTASA